MSVQFNNIVETSNPKPKGTDTVVKGDQAIPLNVLSQLKETLQNDTEIDGKWSAQMIVARFVLLNPKFAKYQEELTDLVIKNQAMGLKFASSAGRMALYGGVAQAGMSFAGVASSAKGAYTGGKLAKERGLLHHEYNGAVPRAPAAPGQVGAPIVGRDGTPATGKLTHWREQAADHDAVVRPNDAGGAGPLQGREAHQANANREVKRLEKEYSRREKAIEREENASDRQARIGSDMAQVFGNAGKGYFDMKKEMDSAGAQVANQQYGQVEGNRKNTADIFEQVGATVGKAAGAVEILGNGR